jgi:quercetin dioxygenase-like cupin family protein
LEQIDDSGSMKRARELLQDPETIWTHWVGIGARNPGSQAIAERGMRMRVTTIFGSRLHSRTGVWLLIVAMLSVISLTTAPLASAQDTATPEASPAASPQASPEAVTQQTPPDFQTIFVEDFEALPAAPLTIRLLRITLEPGASVPEHTHPGPEFGYIEEGTLSVTPTGDASVTRAGGGSAETVSETTDLATGDWIVYPAEVGMAFTNATDSNVVILSAVILPVGEGAPSSISYASDEASAEDYTGVSFVVLGDGLLQELADGPATVTVNRVTLAPGTDMPATDSPLLVSRIDGNLSFTVDSGAVQVTRTATPELRPNAAPDSNFTLETGDAAFFPAGMDTASRADQGGELSYYTLSIVPSSGSDADPAQITFTEPTEPAATPESTATPSDGTSGDTSEGLAPGTVVTALEDNLNIRESASTDADVVEQVAAGVELTIVSGPEEAEDYTWYEVEINDSGLTGWTVADFLSGGAAEAETPEATEAAEESGTPEAEVAFAEGDAVVVTDSSVRLRTDPSVDADVIGTLEEGQELTITGGPEEADDYTWYQVESADGAISGWTVGDFLAPAGT